MTNRTLSVPEINCGHCKMSIEDAVGAVDGDPAVVDPAGQHRPRAVAEILGEKPVEALARGNQRDFKN